MDKGYIVTYKELPNVIWMIITDTKINVQAKSKVLIEKLGIEL